MEHLSTDERYQMARNLLKQFAAQKFEAEMILVANRRTSGESANQVRKAQRDKIVDLTKAIEDVEHDYPELLAEPVPASKET